MKQGWPCLRENVFLKGFWILSLPKPQESIGRSKALMKQAIRKSEMTRRASWLYALLEASPLLCGVDT